MSVRALRLWLIRLSFPVFLFIVFLENMYLYNLDLGIDLVTPFYAALNKIGITERWPMFGDVPRTNCSYAVYVLLPDGQWQQNAEIAAPASGNVYDALRLRILTERLGAFEPTRTTLCERGLRLARAKGAELTETCFPISAPGKAAGRPTEPPVVTRLNQCGIVP